MPRMRPRFDIEITTHCNATCSFCPRDDVPFLRHISLDTLDQIILRLQALGRTNGISLCGTGDCSTHPDLIEIVRRLTSVFTDVSITTNGYRINEQRGRDLLDAGLKTIFFSISELGEDYERVYGLPFGPVVANIMRFRELARGRCRVFISPIARQPQDPRARAVKDYWRERGFDEFMVMEFTNRAGSLQDLYDALGEEAGFAQRFAEDSSLGLCPVPFASTLIGPDGNYYLCSHDFRKQRAFGNVATHSVAEAWALKKQYFQQDRQACLGCSANPLSMLSRKNPGFSLHDFRRLIEEDNPAGLTDLQRDKYKQWQAYQQQFLSD